MTNNAEFQNHTLPLQQCLRHFSEDKLLIKTLRKLFANVQAS